MEYDIRIKWLTVARFELRLGNTTIVTEPCISAQQYAPLSNLKLPGRRTDTQ